MLCGRLTFSSTQLTMMEGYLRLSQRKKAGTPMAGAGRDEPSGTHGTGGTSGVGGRRGARREGRAGRVRSRGEARARGAAAAILGAG